MKWHHLAQFVWTLTKTDIIKLERIQKTALRIILDQQYINYENALKKLKLETLEKRREKMGRKFAKKCEKSSKFCKWFIKSIRTNKSNKKYILPSARTTAYERSPLMYLTELLNEHK